MDEPPGNTGGGEDDSSGDVGGGDGDGAGRGGSDHGGIGGIACGLDDCRYQSGRRGNLSRHRITMHSCLPSPLLCCQAAFDTKHEYERHRREAHSAGYRCADCGRVFSRRALLTRHSYIHAERKPFQCGACQRYSTASKSNLRRHRQVCGRPRVGSPSSTSVSAAAAGTAAGHQETYGRGITTDVRSQAMTDRLPPLFRASIHISCGPCGPSAAAPAWLPWPAATDSANLTACLPHYHRGPSARHPPDVSGLGEAGAQSSAFLSQFAPGLFYSPLAMPSRDAAFAGSNGSAHDTLRTTLVNEETVLGKKATDNGMRMFPPKPALDLTEPHHTKHVSLAADGTGTDPSFGEELGERPSAAVDFSYVPRGTTQTQLSKSNGTGKRRKYRSFHVSEILSPDT